MFSSLFQAEDRSDASSSAANQSESEADESALIEAIHRSQAVIEFDPDGTILTANDNFLEVMGYTLAEIEGQHHRIFVEDEYARSQEYRAFWERLGRGEYYTDRLKRIDKEGHEVWLQATYNPVFGPDGEVAKVVKIADDVTEQVETERELAEREEYLSRKVDDLLAAMRRFAEGDLTVQADADADGDIGRLFEGFNEAVARMRDTVGQVVEAVSTAGSTAERVSASADELAAGAEEQSSQAEEVAAAMEEMTRTIAENSEAVTETSDLARKNRKTARKNDQVVLQTVDKMEEIGEVVGRSAEQVETLHATSEEIEAIVETINDIAEQTNLLALNAAIEAARAGGEGRAGQAGQGFAVVAEEVRELASQADEATGEIRHKINRIQEQTQEAVEAMEAGQEEVTAGIELAEETRAAFEEIVEGTETISERMDEIAAATEEQSTTSEQVSQNVESISAVSQQNAKAIHDIVEAIGKFQEVSGSARRLVKQFALEGSARPNSGGEAPGEDFSATGRSSAGDGAPASHSALSASTQ